MQRRLLEVLQGSINRYLSLDPESLPRVKALDGKVVTLQLLGLGITLQLLFVGERIELKGEDFLEPNTYIKGTPLTLLHMAMTKGDRKSFFGEDLSIEGDLDLGQEVIDLFDHLEIDWEEYLSRWVGDVPAYQIGRLVRGIKNFNLRACDTFSQNINEYVHEEANWFPNREGLEDFFTDVDEIRMDVDRMEARVSRLKAALDKSSNLEN